MYAKQPTTANTLLRAENRPAIGFLGVVGGNFCHFLQSVDFAFHKYSYHKLFESGFA
jgi:hypothetical protein